MFVGVIVQAVDQWDRHRRPRKDRPSTVDMGRDKIDASFYQKSGGRILVWFIVSNLPLPILALPKVYVEYDTTAITHFYEQATALLAG